ncbi:MAG: DUF1631 domain-containing protein [Gammaproteobacteria bacterium]|nr:DUF1631 domain-containing protein [Gammaproteobacteria bacterium]NNJ50704.1 DUF1631 family protein [Gammaproteobacteria bacterium]
MSENNKDNEDKLNQYDKLVVDIRNNLVTRLDDLMSKLLNSTQDKLFEMSDAADSNEEQTRYFDLMNEIRTLKPTIAESFSRNIKAYLVPAKNFEARNVKHDEEDDELSLIGQDEMEGIVLVKGIGERATSIYREQLSHLEARLEHLATKTETIFKEDALTPTNFCQAFDDALADDFSNINKKLLFSMFEYEVTNKLDELYDSINNRLIDAGILPQIKLHAMGQKPSPPRPKPSQNTPPEEEGISQQEAQTDDMAGGYSGGYSGGTASSSAAGPAGGGNNIAGFAMTAPPGGGYRHNTQPPHDGGTAGSENSQPAQPGAGGAGAGASGGTTGSQSGDQGPSDGGGEFQHYTAGMPASQVGRVLGNFIGGAPITPSTTDKSSGSHGEFYPESTAQHFGHQEIIQALSNVQSLPQFEQPSEVRFDGEAIKQAVLAEIAKKSGGAVTKRINTIAEKTIDFIELIFDAIIDDDDISDTIKALLLRLQIPIIKASMSDQEFFIYDNHPARVLLDSIADIGVGITDHTDEMYKNLDKIVSNILSEYELTTETFQTALDHLNSIIEEQDTKARKKEEEEQQQLLRKHARATVLKALRASTTGKSLPEGVHPLILKRWPTLMFNHYLKNGKENDEWVNLVLTLRHIVESVQPILTAELLAKLIAEKDALFEQTEKYLNIASSSREDVRSIMEVYREVIQQHIDDANFSEEEVNVAEEIISQAEPVEEAPIEEEPDTDKPTLPSSIMPGMWFQLHMGDDEVPRRCKLSVIIVEDANLMFVNHKGELVAEKSFDEFNQEIANNQSKMIMGHSAFDHAFKAVIDRLN